MIKAGKMLAEVLAHLFKKPATCNYPAEKSVKPDKFRGKIQFDATKCIGCKMCMRDCPAKAITITKIGDKQFEATIDIDKCLFCAQCVDTCPKDALASSKEFELAHLDRPKRGVSNNEKQSGSDPET
jgi:formate hydrogenlyase subunit 6/NADH:ubiquinone oxidoreductase subunit I